MITFIIGKPKKKLEGDRVELSSENLSRVFDEMQTPSLFGEQKTFILSQVFEDNDVKKFIIDQLETLENAPHQIIILEPSILAADLKKIEKFAKVEKNSEKEKKEIAAFNPFALANAFAEGDKKKTWITFQEVALHDDEIEKTHGMIWWKLKDMFQKRSPFSKQQLVSMARDLVDVYHKSRYGGLSMKERLEKFFLTMPNIK